MPKNSPDQFATSSAGLDDARARIDLALFSLTLFLAAYLLFLVQPLMGRYVLPWFGGGAGVWTSCMLFFQVVLLVGYVYAHILDKYLPPHRQMTVHVAVLALSLVSLPISPAVDWQPTGAAAPEWHILLLLAAHVGLPFAVLASSTPLLSAWYRRRFPKGSPYRLYALSNTGSLLALLAYPFAIEPLLSLQLQSRGWAGLYFAFIVLCSLLTWTVYRRGGQATTAPGSEATTRSDDGVAVAASWRRFGYWLLLAATGSVMLLATSAQISREVSVVPMMWILPLAVYLLTFILCFERDRWYDRRVFTPLLLVASALLVLPVGSTIDLVYLGQLSAFIFIQFVCCMCCHGELARLRPEPGQLTRFYFALALGGALGGAFTALLAPRLFDYYWELPLAIVATIIFVGNAIVREQWAKAGSLLKPRFLAVITPMVVVVCTVVTIFSMQLLHWEDRAIATSRNFYGDNRVVGDEDESGPFLEMYNGTISHGKQIMTESLRGVPTTYYGDHSGLGLAIRLLRERHDDQNPASTAAGESAGLNIGVVGLGVGTAAALAQAGDRLKFYEINPDVERFARRYFTYLQNTEAEVEVVLGDARVSMAREAREGRFQQFDILVLDAFNSDSVPVHLLTREAYELFRSHLRPGGVLAFHTSNRHLALAPVVYALAREQGDSAARIISTHNNWFQVSLADWVLASGDPGFMRLPQIAVEATPWQDWERQERAWTDDYSSVLGAIFNNGKRLRNKWASAPNKGRFVVDVAGAIDRSRESAIRDICRALYVDSGASVPMLFVSSGPLGGRDKVAPMADSFVEISQMDGKKYILVFIGHADGRVVIKVGGWSPREQRYLEHALQDSLQESMQEGSMSDALLKVAEVADYIVRNVIGLPSS